MYWSLQGNIGLGKAIEYFTSHQIPISIPLNDTQPYDLVVELNNELKRISVKTSNNKTQYNTYVVNLRNCGGSSGKNKNRPFNNNTCDYVFVLTGDNKTYFIPSNKIDNVNSINIGKKYTEYEVVSKPLLEFKENS